MANLSVSVTSPHNNDWIRTSPMSPVTVKATAHFIGTVAYPSIDDVTVSIGGVDHEATSSFGSGPRTWTVAVTPPVGWDLKITVTATGTWKTGGSDGPTEHTATGSASITLRADNTPPVIVLASPLDGAVITGSDQGATVRCYGSVKDQQSSVHRVVLGLENGSLQTLQLDGNGFFSTYVALNPGAQTIAITADDILGNSATASVNVTVQSPVEKGRTSGTHLTYDFANFFHPFLAELIQRLNSDPPPGAPAGDPLAGIMDPIWQDSLKTPDPISQANLDFFNLTYKPNITDTTFDVVSYRKEIELAGGPYSNYNWELFFHIPMTVAVHLSKTQRFAEAQKWFHFIFDPTSNDLTTDPPQRFWKFLAFREAGVSMQIDQLLTLLSTPTTDPADQKLKAGILNGYDAILNNPFQPYAVARTRPAAFQYSVVMKYLDNLIAWGDSLFLQDTIETINEATQIYILASNILGPRPQRIPPSGSVPPKTFAQLKSAGLDAMGNTLVELEGQFPFNLAPGSGASGGDASGALFGIGRTLYFCVPRNDKLLGYWDTVADRLFKIRHCMNIAGVVRPLALFDPPIDPGMLVKAAAAGLDIGSVVSGLSQPIGPVRCLTFLQKALELCSEVRSLGGALLSALEKGDAEHLAVLRQGQEIQIQQMALEVRFLQFRSAQESTKSLLRARDTAMERLRYYQRLLGLPADPNAPDTITLNQASAPDDPPGLTAENFDEAYGNLVGQYDKTLSMATLPALKIAANSSPSNQSGASGTGSLYLNTNEDAELNTHLPTARDTRLAANVTSNIASFLTFIPDFNIDLHYWGLGGDTGIFGGKKLSDAGRFGAEILQTIAGYEQDQAGMAGRTAGHQRRADDWMLQYNLAAHELVQNGRQILTSLIAEQIAQHDYQSTAQQITNANAVNDFLNSKFTNEELYLWTQGEVSRLYYEYYRLAFDTARRAERTMKQELMRPELDAQDFVSFNYWDGGRKGLLSGEALHLDLKRMELAYHDNNKRELELTRHVSLRQLNPLALLTLRATASCQVSIPEWLYDRDCPGHYMRRIKSVALTVPSVVGPYTTVNCTLTLLSSSVRTSPDGDYLRQGSQDSRFVDYAGSVQSVVTSMAVNDSGMFETNLRDDRFLPFEGSGAISTWKLDLPATYRGFDYSTISDVILHVRYTARQGVDATQVTTALDDIFQQASESNFALLLDLRHDFPTPWAAFVNGSADYAAIVRRDFFPYFTTGKTITITGLALYNGQDPTQHANVGDPTTATTNLAAGQFTLSSAPSAILARSQSAQPLLIATFTVS